jgi:hypothetical protein
MSRQIELIPRKQGGRRKPAKGADYFAEPYPNILLLARKKSGKTTIIYNIIKNCAGPDTEVVIFCPTWRKDDSYRHIIKYMNKKQIEHQEFTNLYDGKNNILREFMQNLAAQSDSDNSDPDSDPEPSNPPDCLELCALSCQATGEKQQKKKASKYTTPEFIFIFDDMRSQNRDKAVSDLITTNRHYKAMVIVSTQFVTDFTPTSWANLDYALLFPKLPTERLPLIREALGLAKISLEDFMRSYADATDAEHNFLYIDMDNEELKRNF